jgi:glycosyltransferase involved in cell wall biosynthesis
MKQKVLIFIVSYNAERFIEQVLARIPREIYQHSEFDAEVLVIDDQSQDRTFENARRYAEANPELKITVLYNPKNQGYGGNQKIGYYYAIQNEFDLVVLLHGDGQYAPECLPAMIEPILTGTADVVIGSRMIHKFNALKGRMPVYKWIGNQILTTWQNWILNSHLSEFHSGYRAYRMAALKSIPFSYNSDDFDFDTEILIQLLQTGRRFQEIAVPTFYGQELCHVNGLKYALQILIASLHSRIVPLGLFYHPQFDYHIQSPPYESKLGFSSSHQFTLDRVAPETTVLDLGCGPGFMARELSKRHIRVISVDHSISDETRQYSLKSVSVNLDQYDFDSENHPVDTILLLDIIEHLRSPEVFLEKLRHRYAGTKPTIILTTGNIAFIVTRLSLLFGQFNYARRGILDFTHARLYTFASLRRSLMQSGFEILETHGIPGPFPLAFGDSGFARFLVGLNRLLIRLCRGLFAYQIAMVIKPRPTLQVLLEAAKKSRPQN